MSPYPYLVKLAQSEPVAWAVQNAVGVLFAMMFSVVWPLNFTLACVSSVLFTAASTVLSIDRTVGGRLFSASMFVGAMLSGGVLGGAVSSLAWLARGGSKGIAVYAGDAQAALERIGNLTLSEAEQLGLISPSNPVLEAIERTLGAEIRSIESENVIQIVGNVIELADSGAAEKGVSLLPEPLQVLGEDLFTVLGEGIPRISTGFWVLLIVLFSVVALPMSIARASENFKVGLLMAITTLFCGSQVVFATLMPVLGVELYWKQIVTGYIKVALVNGAGMVLAALLVYVRSSHDAAREKFGEVFKRSGVVLSGIASNVGRIKVGRAEEGGYVVDGAGCVSLRNEAKRMAAETVDEVHGDKSKAKAKAKAKSDGKDDVEDSEAPTGYAHASTDATSLSAFKLRASCQTIEDQLAVCLFEVPLPGVTSHVGARRGDFVELLRGLRTLLSTLCCIETIYPTGAQELARSGHDTAPVQCVMAAVASVLGGLSPVLSTMPVLGVCKGKKLAWRPRDSSFWDGLERDITSFAKVVRDEAIKDNIRMSERGRDMMLLMMNCQTLISDAKACEALAATALDVVAPSSKDSLSLKERIVGNGYLPALLVNSILLSVGVLRLGRLTD